VVLCNVGIADVFLLAIDEYIDSNIISNNEDTFEHPEVSQYI